MKKNVVHNINALSGLNMLEDNSVDIVCTDPPAPLDNYGAIFQEINRVLKPTGHFILYTAWHFKDQVVNYFNIIRKGNKQFRLMDQKTCFEFDRKTYLNTEKCLPTVKGYLPLTKEKLLVLDPFAGSGTSLVAAKELGYDFIGFEIDFQVFKICADRLWSGEKTPSLNKDMD